MKKLFTNLNDLCLVANHTFLKIGHLLGLLFTVYFMSAQGNFDLVETYTLEVKSMYQKPGKKNLNEFYITDRLYFIPQTEVMHITNTLDSKDNYETTIVYERPEHFEKWMIHPSKSIISGGEITVFDEKNKVISKEKISKEKNEEIKDIVKEIRKSGKAQNINFDAADLDEVAKNKGKYKKLSYYSEEIEYDSIIYRNLPEKLSKQYLKKENGKPKESHAIKYEKVKGQGDYFFKNSKNMKNITLKDTTGKDTELIESTEINCYNYKLNKSSKLATRNQESMQSELISLSENPINANYMGITITAKADLLEINSLSLNIYNSIGQLVKEVSLNPTITQHSIDVETLPSGTYFLQGFILNQKQTIKFIKI